MLTEAGPNMSKAKEQSASVGLDENCNYCRSEEGASSSRSRLQTPDSRRAKGSWSRIGTRYVRSSMYLRLCHEVIVVCGVTSDRGISVRLNVHDACVLLRRASGSRSNSVPSTLWSLWDTGNSSMVTPWAEILYFP